MAKKSDSFVRQWKFGGKIAFISLELGWLKYSKHDFGDKLKTWFRSLGRNKFVPLRFVKRNLLIDSFYKKTKKHFISKRYVT